ncbi:MAG TPA: hypothetical protein VFP61_14800 [Acidimicrobiales bacterium]|nr:hypothetical protein [Acidimicrobiales bacterium]
MPRIALHLRLCFVRLVRSGGTRQRFQPRRFRLGDDGDWLDVTDEADPEPIDPEVLDAIDEALLLRCTTVLFAGRPCAHQAIRSPSFSWL